MRKIKLFLFLLLLFCYLMAGGCANAKSVNDSNKETIQSNKSSTKKTSKPKENKSDLVDDEVVPNSKEEVLKEDDSTNTTSTDKAAIISTDSNNKSSATEMKTESNHSEQEKESSCSTKTVHHDAVTHTEEQLVSEAYDEPNYTSTVVVICNGCGLTFSSTSEWDSHASYMEDTYDDWNHGSYSVSTRQTIIGYIHHEAVYRTVTVVDTPAWNENIKVGC